MAAHPYGGVVDGAEVLTPAAPTAARYAGVSRKCAATENENATGRVTSADGRRLSERRDQRGEVGVRPVDSAAARVRREHLRLRRRLRPVVDRGLGSWHTSNERSPFQRVNTDGRNTR